jgi:hypothetical protein
LVFPSLFLWLSPLPLLLLPPLLEPVVATGSSVTLLLVVEPLVELLLLFLPLSSRTRIVVRSFSLFPARRLR